MVPQRKHQKTMAWQEKNGIHPPTGNSKRESGRSSLANKESSPRSRVMFCFPNTWWRARLVLASTVSQGNIIYVSSDFPCRARGSGWAQGRTFPHEASWAGRLGMPPSSHPRAQLGTSGLGFQLRHHLPALLWAQKLDLHASLLHYLCSSCLPVSSD